MALLIEQIRSSFDQADYESVISRWTASGSVPSLEPLCAQLVAASYFYRGMYADSFSLLESIESCFAGVSSFYSLFGVVSRRLGKFEQSEEFLLKALELDPTSLAAKNNLANLYIDLHRFDESSLLLDSILQIDPSFSDAIHNKSRLSEVKSKLSVNSAQMFSEGNSFRPADPLLLAFSQDEVDRTTSSIKPKLLNKAEKNLLTDLPDVVPAQVLKDQINLASQANRDSNYHLSLDLCSSIYESCLPETLGSLYDVAGDAYIGLKLYLQAETCYNTSGNLDGFTFKHFFNLASIAAVRRDLILAKSYLLKARQLEPDNENLPNLEASFTNLSSNFKFLETWTFDVQSNP